VQTSGTAAGIVKDEHFDDSVFKSWGNRYEGNSYELADVDEKYFQWMNAPRTREEWQGFGNDVRGR
jgi:hypothetical protein